MSDDLTPLKIDVAQPMSSLIVPFEEKPISIVVIGGLPWLSFENVCSVLRIPPEDTWANRVAAVHKQFSPFEGTDRPERRLVSPIGAWTLTLYAKPWADEGFQKWIFREIKKVSPDAFKNPTHGAAQKMALRPDGMLPPRPSNRSGRMDEWLSLNFSSEHRTATALRHSPVAHLRATAAAPARLPTDQSAQDEALDQFMQGVLARSALKNQGK